MWLTGGSLVCDARMAVLHVAAFKVNVALVRTDQFWDTEADAMFHKGWRQHLEEWNKAGSDYPSHYLGSGKTMLHIGQDFGEAVVEPREMVNEDAVGPKVNPFKELYEKQLGSRPNERTRSSGNPCCARSAARVKSQPNQGRDGNHVIAAALELGLPHARRTALGSAGSVA